jgi:hypothetical protein
MRRIRLAPLILFLLLLGAAPGCRALATAGVVAASVAIDIALDDDCHCPCRH